MARELVSDRTRSPFVVVDAYIGRAIGRRMQVYVSAENLADVVYDTGRTPVRTIGWPRTFRTGVRVALEQAMDSFDVAGANLNATELAALERARAATDTLRVLLANKTTMIADEEAARKNRSLLRAKANGIAKRADIVEQQVTRIRS